MGPIPWWKPAAGIGGDCSVSFHEEDLPLFPYYRVMGLQWPWQEGEARTGHNGFGKWTQS